MADNKIDFNYKENFSGLVNYNIWCLVRVANNSVSYRISFSSSFICLFSIYLVVGYSWWFVDDKLVLSSFMISFYSSPLSVHSHKIHQPRTQLMSDLIEIVCWKVCLLLLDSSKLYLVVIPNCCGCFFLTRLSSSIFLKGRTLDSFADFYFFFQMLKFKSCTLFFWLEFGWRSS